MPNVKRESIVWFEDLAGNVVYVGDRVAVAVASKYYNGLRLGEVLEVTGVWDAVKSAWTGIRVKVNVDTTSRGGWAGHSYNMATGQWESKPYVKTYDAASRVVKIS